MCAGAWVCETETHTHTHTWVCEAHTHTHIHRVWLRHTHIHRYPNLHLCGHLSKYYKKKIWIPIASSKKKYSGLHYERTHTPTHPHTHAPTHPCMCFTYVHAPMRMCCNYMHVLQLRAYTHVHVIHLCILNVRWSAPPRPRPPPFSTGKAQFDKGEKVVPSTATKP